MIRVAGREFREVSIVDFEFYGAPGEVVRPVCLVAHELGTGVTRRLWADEFVDLSVAPYATDHDALVVAYYASAELGCHEALGWPQPENVLDLFTEFRTLTNGTQLAAGSGLLGALSWHGIAGIAAEEKDTMRDLVLSGGPWSDVQREAILDYCESDVVALTKLLASMEASIDLPRALLRGRYMKAAAPIETIGVPIDLPQLLHLRERWDGIQDHLIAAVDADYGVYEGRHFREHRFAGYLANRGIAWPLLPSGRLQLDDDTFKEMAKVHLELSPLRVTLGQMRLSDLAVGDDGRNRCLLSAFRARTGRNQPSNKKFIYGPAVWLRGLIRPAVGYAIAYVDWSQQEFGIAAALSGDLATKGDPPALPGRQ